MARLQQHIIESEGSVARNCGNYFSHEEPVQKTTPDDNFVCRFIGLNRVQRLGVSMQASDITGRRSVESPFSSLHNAEKTPRVQN